MLSSPRDGGDRQQRNGFITIFVQPRELQILV
jgi:hypothetical protein